MSKMPACEVEKFVPRAKLETLHSEIEKVLVINYVTQQRNKNTC